MALPKIMVVDDEPDLQMLILQKFRKQIQNEDYQFVFAENGEEALTHLNGSDDITLILSDINMPKMDGLTLLQRLQEKDNPALKTVIVSAYGDMENIRTAMNRGAFDFVTKPIDFNDLHLTIQKGMKEVATIKSALDDRKRLVAVQSDLDAAHRIQQQILPQEFPPFPHRSEFSIYAEMHPAKDVGGDFYDFFLIDETHLGFVVGDVSGKGIPAAIYMAVARTMIKSFASQILDPAACLSKVNTMLIPESDPRTFVTVFYGVLDTSTGVVRYCNGGHNLPFIIRNNGAVEQVEDSPGIILGKFESFKFGTRELQCREGDRLLLYTDGVTEAINEAGEMYMEQRLLPYLDTHRAQNPDNVVRGVVVDVLKFMGKALQSDDVTVLCLEYRAMKS
ncbi:MAG: SpoIIE family protein phosphatase [Bacteroidetes bacterium]|nr:SpoIIE family protein phosphatase [Bacteroidota bacterium]MCW5895547.1 SpoIIE family protein phosphatase [Bacteroidota bacterium]